MDLFLGVALTDPGHTQTVETGKAIIEAGIVFEMFPDCENAFSDCCINKYEQ